MTTRARASALLLLLATACAGSGSSIDRLWRELEADAANSAPLADPDAERQAATADRARRARELHEARKLHTGLDHMRAAVLLAESPSAQDWPLAAELGAKAAELGEPRGLRVAAEAIDKDLVSQGRLQRYGTQFSWDARAGRWRLHPMDPSTTDQERAAMGVPTYAELVKAEIEMNAGAKSPQ